MFVDKKNQKTKKEKLDILWSANNLKIVICWWAIWRWINSSGDEMTRRLCVWADPGQALQACDDDEEEEDGC